MQHKNIIGVTSLFFPLFCRYHSKRALVVLLNGILFHSNPKSICLRRYDIFCNILICIYTFKQNHSVGKHILFACCNWIINLYLLKNIYINSIIGDYYHVFGVQFPLSYGLQNALMLN